jgi:CheY-like chemotaxis protein
MSRMTAGRIRLEKQSVPVVAPLREAIESITPAADAKRIELHVETDPSPGNVYGDDGRLRQIFWNLLSNAVKFTPEGGQIHIGLRADHDSVSVTVRDSGVGMAPAFVPHVFEAFRQADIGSSRRYGGLGLGLAICKQLAELHGGSISAASDGPGRGATFTVRLPRYVQDPVTTPPSPTTAGPAPSRSPSSRCDVTGMDVLAVDDDPDSLDLARHLLANMGAVVRTASDAAEALRQFDARVPDLLVVDIGLPEMDGCELLQEIRSRGEEGRSAPAIAVTAYARSDDRLRTYAAGFDGHVAKPIDPDAFARTVAQALGSIRPHRPEDVPLA